MKNVRITMIASSLAIAYTLVALLMIYQKKQMAIWENHNTHAIKAQTPIAERSVLPDDPFNKQAQGHRPQINPMNDPLAPRKSIKDVEPITSTVTKPSSRPIYDLESKTGDLLTQ